MTSSSHSSGGGAGFYRSTQPSVSPLLTRPRERAPARESVKPATSPRWTLGNANQSQTHDPAQYPQASPYNRRHTLSGPTLGASGPVVPKLQPARRDPRASSRFSIGGMGVPSGIGTKKRKYGSSGDPEDPAPDPALKSRR